MPKQNRLTLQKYFADGAMPSVEQFADLIDSTLNTSDDGFNKSVERGFEISALGNSNALVSFSRDSNPMEPFWSIKFDEHDQHSLTFVPAQLQTRQSESSEINKNIVPALTLSREGRVGVQTDTPAFELDVNGTMRCKTRLGATPERLVDEKDGKQGHELVKPGVPADGRWHNITGPLKGCQALEVMAGVGDKKGQGRYALLHAIALNTFNPTGWLFNFLGWKTRIKCRQSFYHRRSHKLALRWFRPKTERDEKVKPRDRQFVLQIKSNVHYGKDKPPPLINYHITALWTDHMMKQSSAIGKNS